MDEAYRLADRVCILNRGHIVAEGSPEDLINRHGGGNTLIVRGCDTGAVDGLIAALPGGKVEGNAVVVKLHGDDGMAAMVKAISILGPGGFSCMEFYVKKPTLEDVFLNLTGERLAE